MVLLAVVIVFSTDREQCLGDLMKETDDMSARRKACREMKELLQRAVEIVNEV